MEMVSSSKDEERSFTAVDGGHSSPRRRSRRCRNICLAVSTVIGIAILILVILCFTVFKAKDPTTAVTSVVLKDLDVALNIPRVGVDVNLTLDAGLTVKNPNKVGFKYKNSTADFNYRGSLVGQAHIGAGEISGDQTKPMNVTVTVMADRFVGKSELFSDVMAGTLPFNTVVKISGKVKVFGILKFSAVSTASCDFNIYVSNRTVGEQKCKYKTKL